MYEWNEIRDKGGGDHQVKGSNVNDLDVENEKRTIISM
jgi:hypothetical protein